MGYRVRYRVRRTYLTRYPTLYPCQWCQRGALTCGFPPTPRCLRRGLRFEDHPRSAKSNQIKGGLQTSSGGWAGNHRKDEEIKKNVCMDESGHVFRKLHEHMP